ncbi:Uu.00g120030.m01.CDS01 [Anthostomella pinea]|uniref:Uu.00g120030.m01.CDS01 n=1 Tax=Anthostomella pinea TaxID=933095 RepID=A0AAI8VGN2_9PEZI|nr:Uu.00g120030.m01.CDS01 [Anthostomella pinea]
MEDDVPMDWTDPDQFAQHHGFLWISEKPGAGKSILIKFLYLHTKKNTNNDATISFFFNARGDELKTSTAGMQRSLLVQLVERFSDLQVVLDNLKVSRIGNIDVLRDAFSVAISRLGQRRLTCFIDALDECDQHQVQDMITYFEGIGEYAIGQGIKFLVCFSSRHYPYIYIENGIKLTLEDQPGHGHDLEKYMRSKLRVGPKKRIEEISGEVLQKASGVFMWVVLVVNILNDEFKRGRLFVVKKRLREIPPKLSDLFKDILTQDSHNLADLLLCVQWILFAKRPLRLEEFYFVVVSGLDASRLSKWDPEETAADDMN